MTIVRTPAGLAAALLLLTAGPARADVTPDGSILYFDFARGTADRAGTGGKFLLRGGLEHEGDGPLAFTSARQSAELDEAGTAALSARHLAQGELAPDSVEVVLEVLIFETGPTREAAPRPAPRAGFPIRLGARRAAR